MVLKADQQRVKALLAETITLLCKNGLNFKREFSIEGLIGITLDQDDVFLVSIKETIRSAVAEAAGTSQSGKAAAVGSNSVAAANTSSLGRRRRERADAAAAVAAEVKRTGSPVLPLLMPVTDTADIGAGDQRTSEGASKTKREEGGTAPEDGDATDVDESTTGGRNGDD